MGVSAVFYGFFIVSAVAAPMVEFTLPSPGDGSYINQDWTYLNVSVSVNDSSNTSSFIDWNRSLVGYWSFDSCNASGCYDNSPYSNFGTFQGGLGTSNITTGKYGSGLEFDGVDDYINCGNDSSLDITDAITIEAWIYRNDYDDWQGIAVRNYRYPYGLGLSNLSWLESSFTFVDGYCYGYGDVVPKLQWTHVVSTWDKSTGNVIQYQNGAAKVVLTGKTSSMNLTTTYKLLIGSRANGNQNFNGSIDEVRIWNRALTPEEINASYNSGKWRLERNFTNLPEGSYEYYAHSIDLAGNSRSTETRTVTVDTVPPDPVADLDEIDAGSSWITWGWTNPGDLNFDHTEVYLNGNFMTNVSAPSNSYTATGLTPLVEYEIQTRTVDKAGNLGEWANDTATTTKLSRRKQRMSLEVNASFVSEQVTVKILDQRDEPLEEVEVDVFYNDEKVAYGLTDEDGLFEFVPSLEGVYMITARRSRYYDLETEVEVLAYEMSTTTIATTTTMTLVTTTTRAPGTTTTTKVAYKTTTTVTTTTTAVSTTTTLPPGGGFPWAAAGAVVFLVVGGGAALYLISRGKGGGSSLEMV